MDSGQEGIQEEFISLGIGFNLCQAHFFNEPVLEQTEGYFDAAFGLGEFAGVMLIKVRSIWVFSCS